MWAESEVLEDIDCGVVGKVVRVQARVRGSGGG